MDWKVVLIWSQNLMDSLFQYIDHTYFFFPSRWWIIDEYIHLEPLVLISPSLNGWNGNQHTLCM